MDASETEARHIEQALRESERRLKRTEEIAHLGSWELDLRTGVLTWSDEVYRIFGLQPQEFAATYDRFLQHVHPDDRSAVTTAYTTSIHEGRDTYEFEHRIVREDTAEVRWVLEKCEHVRDPNGTVVLSTGMVLDITERKHTEAALRESEGRLRLFIEYAPVALAMFDREMRYLSASRRWLVDYGLEERFPGGSDNLRGWSHYEVFPDVPDRWRELHRRGLTGEVLRADEDPFQRVDGSVQWLRWEIRPWRDVAGQIAGIVIFSEEITDRKRAEEDLAAAKAAAETANAAKDHFLAVLSHELRTPLAPVVAGLSILQRNPNLDPTMHDSLEMIRRNVELEARLIDDLLDVTRIARGKTELHRRPVQLREVIRRTVEVVSPDLDARQLEFGIDAGDSPESPYVVDVDPTRLQQVFWNLLRNAVKFTPHGGCVGVRYRDDGTGHVVIEVRDSGEGIAPEALARIFNAFEQAEPSVTRQFGGLGLGLAISKALVEQHGGTIEASSAGKGMGATFRVRLPLACAEPPTEAPRAAPAAAPRPLQILLVEDHGDTARVMQLLLRREGHRVERAGDVSGGLALAREGRFDLLISDLGLPDGSGLDLMRTLRRQGSRMPGIALTGYGQEEDIRRSREAGFAVHLTKPVSPEQLAEAIATILPGGSAA